MLSRWYVVIFIIFLILLLVISAYNLYETFRIKSKVPSEYHESQDILIAFNIIAIVIILILFVGLFFARSDLGLLSQNYPMQTMMNLYPSQPLETQPTAMQQGQLYATVCKGPNPFSNATRIDVNRIS